jgi:hypothetical protein
MMTTNPVLEQRPHRHSAPSARATHLGRVVIGAVLAAIGFLGALRTFDPVQLSATQLVFLLMIVVGVALTELRIRD